MFRDLMKLLLVLAFFFGGVSCVAMVSSHKQELTRLDRNVSKLKGEVEALRRQITDIETMREVVHELQH